MVFVQSAFAQSASQERSAQPIPREMSPAEFEALMPDIKLLESLTFDEFKALMPDANYLYSDEPEMESSLHYSQLALLMSCLELFWEDRNDFFIAANLTIYYSPQQIKTRDFRGPDFFFVKGAMRRDRLSWVIWEEGGKFPNVIIELLSEGTASVDRSTKKELYAHRFKTPEYFWFGPNSMEFVGFRLIKGEYEAILPNAQGHLWSEEMELFLGIHDRKLRYFDPQGQMVPTPREDAKQAMLQASIAVLRANEERIRATEERINADKERVRAAMERINADEERIRAAAARISADKERIRADEAQALAAAERSRADEERSRAAAERSRADEERSRADEERSRSKKLADYLQSLGIDPNSI